MKDTLAHQQFVADLLRSSELPYVRSGGSPPAGTPDSAQASAASRTPEPQKSNSLGQSSGAAPHRLADQARSDRGDVLLEDSEQESSRRPAFSEGNLRWTGAATSLRGQVHSGAVCQRAAQICIGSNLIYPRLRSRSAESVSRRTAARPPQGSTCLADAVRRAEMQSSDIELTANSHTPKNRRQTFPDRTDFTVGEHTPPTVIRP